MRKLKYAVSLFDATIDHYRLDWTPQPGFHLAGMWAPAVVTDQSGQNYLGLRGWNDYVLGMTHTVSPTCGFRALSPGLDTVPSHLYAEYSGFDWFEPFQYTQTKDTVAFSYDSGRLVRDDRGIHWLDAGGRWEIHGKTVSKTFLLYVPEQEGVEQPVYYRHELIMARGSVNGVAVEGYLHQDYCYGPPGTTYMDLPIIRGLERMWVSWIHIYADGEMGGGCFWQGTSDIDFRPGYVLRNGQTIAYSDVNASLLFADNGKPQVLHVEINNEWFDFTMESAGGGPLHFFGRLTASSSGKEIQKSWCWIEHTDGIPIKDVMAYMDEKFRLARRR